MAPSTSPAVHSTVQPSPELSAAVNAVFGALQLLDEIATAPQAIENTQAVRSAAEAAIPTLAQFGVGTVRHESSARDSGEHGCGSSSEQRPVDGLGAGDGVLIDFARPRRQAVRDGKAGSG